MLAIAARLQQRVEDPVQRRPVLVLLAVGQLDTVHPAVTRAQHLQEPIAVQRRHRRVGDDHRAGTDGWRAPCRRIVEQAVPDENRGSCARPARSPRAAPRRGGLEVNAGHAPSVGAAPGRSRLRLAARAGACMRRPLLGAVPCCVRLRCPGDQAPAATAPAVGDHASQLQLHQDHVEQDLDRRPAGLDHESGASRGTRDHARRTGRAACASDRRPEAAAGAYRGAVVASAPRGSSAGTRPRRCEASSCRLASRTTAPPPVASTSARAAAGSRAPFARRREKPPRRVARSRRGSRSRSGARSRRRRRRTASSAAERAGARHWTCRLPGMPTNATTVIGPRLLNAKRRPAAGA